jgi:hypothetical protein
MEAGMHYHLLVIDDHGEHLDSATTFDTQREAEEQAAAVVREIGGPGWEAKRYPGRMWRPQEIAVYLDRRPLERTVPRLELAILRCKPESGEHDVGCYLEHRGLRF